LHKQKKTKKWNESLFFISKNKKILMDIFQSSDYKGSGAYDAATVAAGAA
jgi:hypothetical protein